MMNSVANENAAANFDAQLDEIAVGESSPQVLEEVVDLQEFAKLLRTFPETILRCLLDLYHQHSTYTALPRRTISKNKNKPFYTFYANELIFTHTTITLFFFVHFFSFHKKITFVSQRRSLKVSKTKKLFLATSFQSSAPVIPFMKIQSSPFLTT